MPALDTQRAAIATALATVTGLRVDAEGLWPDRTNLPAAHVRPADANTPLNLTLTEWFEAYEVVVLTSLAGGIQRGQRALDDLYNAVVAACVDIAAVLNVTRQAYGVIEVDGAECTGFVLRLEMIG